ncbi:hypothetical protein NE865_01999 [Phthorimaea operculella]|nr:hypothetical protein NE865_01999 [Phthorimaea operculella]
MNTVDDEFSYNSTAGSTHGDSDVIKVRNYVKDLLKSRIFLGRYMERRLSDPRVGYRDVVVISPAEVELKRDLAEAQHKLRSTSATVWIGITDGEPIGHPGICIWTEIDNQPFGAFWFQIRSVKFREHEVIVTVKCIRHISESFLEVEPILTGSAKKKVAAPQSGQPDSTTNSTEALSETYTEFKETLKSALSIRNVKEFVTFLCAFVIAVFTGTNAFVNFLGFLDFLSKIVGGFYILVAMFFKPSNPVPVDRRSIAYNYEHKRRRSFSPHEFTID